jgi:hypothetical protein
MAAGTLDGSTLDADTKLNERAFGRTAGKSIAVEF